MSSQPLEQAEQDPGIPELTPEWQALEMVDAFASVGAVRFALTVKAEGKTRQSFRPDCSIEQLRMWMGAILGNAATRERSVIVRPIPGYAPLVQLDDLHAGKVERLKPYAFLVLCTSPGNYQAWLAVSGADGDFKRRLKQGIGGDTGATEATRISGSVNFKAKYAPAFPMVRTVHVALGLVVGRAELEAAGLVGPVPRPSAAAPPPVSPRSSSRRRRPLDYGRWLANAPRRDGSDEPDVSRADVTWCMTCIERGFTVQETAEMLMERSPHAFREGWRYARRTAEYAAKAQGDTGGGA